MYIILYKDYIILLPTFRMFMKKTPLLPRIVHLY